MIIGVWGEDKTCKSTFALTAPRSIAHLSFDIGGFDRACRNFPHATIKDWVKSKEIINMDYIMPFTTGSIDPVKGIIRQSKIIRGVKELFYKWLYDYVELLQDGKTTLTKFGFNKPVSSIIVDTGTLLYNTVICDGYLQELQEKQLRPGTEELLDPKDRLRSVLQQNEYREPYDRIRGIIYQAKAHKKNLILTHHATDEFKPMQQRDGTFTQSATGKRERHGWKQLGDSADLILHTYIKEEPVLDDKGKPIIINGKKQVKRVPYCSVDLAEVQELVGMEFREPTFDSIAEVIKMIREGMEN